VILSSISDFFAIHHARLSLQWKTYLPKDHGICANSIDRNAVKILQVLIKNGHESYIVGGGVRDLLLNKSPKDFDVVTEAHPQQVRRLFRHSICIGRRFPIVHVRHPGGMIEVTTFRRSKPLWQVFKKKNDCFYGSLSTDVLRRDLTINALYYDIRDGSIRDAFDGYQDIKQRQIKVIGKVSKRLHEDPIRMLRIIRISAKLNFQIPPKTFSFMKHSGHLLLNTSKERVYLEIIKSFYFGDGCACWKIMQELSLWQALSPTLHKLCCAQPMYAQFIQTFLANSDQRFQEDKKRSVVFLFAVLFWPLFFDLQQTQQKKKKSSKPKLDQLMHLALVSSIGHMKLPRSVVESVQQIWHFQLRWHNKRAYHIKSVTQHRRFHAAYDFLVLRALFNPKLGPLVKFWGQYKVPISSQD
jgi:poly(A) polymerase